MNCPRCSSRNTRVYRSRLCANGARRRRIDCQDCGHRWTDWQGQRPAPNGRSTRLSDDQVRLALTRMDVSNIKMGRLLGCSAEMVRQIRCGMVCRDVLPELIRPRDKRPPAPSDGPRCDRCEHWTGERCDWGFPDPLEEGLGFARDCDMYEPGPAPCAADGV